LLDEWLGGRGFEVFDDANAAARNGFDLIVVDVPFPRHGGLDLLKRVTAEYPDAPTIAVSSSFFADVRCDGALARELGVAGVLPKPLRRDALFAAVDGLIDA
jgi:CheY-like chemotaxis protein